MWKKPMRMVKGHKSHDISKGYMQPTEEKNTKHTTAGFIYLKCCHMEDWLSLFYIVPRSRSDTKGVSGQQRKGLSNSISCPVSSLGRRESPHDWRHFGTVPRATWQGSTGRGSHSPWWSLECNASNPEIL